MNARNSNNLSKIEWSVQKKKCQNRIRKAPTYPNNACQKVGLICLENVPYLTKYTEQEEDREEAKRWKRKFINSLTLLIISLAIECPSCVYFSYFSSFYLMDLHGKTVGYCLAKSRTCLLRKCALPDKIYRTGGEQGGRKKDTKS